MSSSKKMGLMHPGNEHMWLGGFNGPADNHSEKIGVMHSGRQTQPRALNHPLNSLAPFPCCSRAIAAWVRPQ
jgi:hypothetical protein